MDLLDYRVALRYYRHLLEKEPGREGLRTESALALIQLGEYREAEPLLKEESRLFPRSRKPLVLLAFLHLQEGDCARMEDVVARYDGLLQGEFRRDGLNKAADGPGRRMARARSKMEPNLGLPYFALGYCLKRARRFERARAEFERASGMGYDATACRIQLADMALEERDWQGALSLLEDAGAEGAAEFAFLRGCAYEGLGMAEDAIGAFRTACELKPHWAEALENLAGLMTARGETSEAAALLRRVQALAPGTEGVPRDLGRLGSPRRFVDRLSPSLRDPLRSGKETVIREADARFMESIQKGALNEAAEYLGGFLRLHEGDASLTFKLANLLNELGRREDALDQAERVLALERDHKGAWDLRGDILFRIGDFAHALRPYEEVLRLAPGDAMAHYNLGCTQAAMGAEKEAEASWRKVLQLNKPHLREKSDRDGAGDILRYDVNVFANPPAFHARLALGRLYARQGLAARAAEELGEAIRLVPGDPDAYFDLGAACLKLGDGTKAASCFKTYLALGGKREQEARAFLRELE